MNWKLSRISIPVFDLETSKTFYNSILNNQTKNNHHHHLDTDEECFISGGNIDLRLYKLKNEVSNNYILQSRRTFPTLAFNNLDLSISKTFNSEIVKKKVSLRLRNILKDKSI